VFITNIKLVSIDLAKNSFQVCAINQAGKPMMNKKVNRNKLVETVLQLSPEQVVMEACYTANYWGRKFQSYGIKADAIPAQFVKAFVRGNKNDNNDALAIAEAASRPNIKWVPIKAIEQQDLQSIHRARERHIRNRTGLINQTRGLLSEYGIVISKGVKVFQKQLPEILEDASNELSVAARKLIYQLSEELSQINQQIKQDEQLIDELVKDNEDYQRLLSVPGIGPILSSSLIAVGRQRRSSTRQTKSLGGTGE